MKKGIVEMADLVLVNKADGELKTIANHAKVEYMHALQLLRHRSPTWTPMVCMMTVGLGVNMLLLDLRA